METRVFTVAVTGDDVQELAEELRQSVIDITRDAGDHGLDVHVTPEVRVTRFSEAG